jgi:hypothetical protein
MVPRDWAGGFACAKSADAIKSSGKIRLITLEFFHRKKDVSEPNRKFLLPAK